MRARMALTASFLAAIASAGPALPADAFDLTGTWEGKWSCKVFNGEGFANSEKFSTMSISQTGDTMAIEIDGEFYTGRQIPDLGKPAKGEVVVAHCGLSNVPGDAQGELMRAKVKTKEGELKATFKASSIGMDGLPSVYSCNYSYKRVDAVDPGVGFCPTVG